MAAVKQYLLAVVCCAFLISLIRAAVGERKGKAAVALAGGCMMALVVLGPLTGLRPGRLGALLPELPDWRTEAYREAEEKNDELLRSLVAAQTEELIVQKAAEMGAEIRVRVTAEKNAEGLFVPVGAELSGRVGTQARAALAKYLREELGIEPERQRWRTE